MNKQTVDWLKECKNVETTRVLMSRRNTIPDRVTVIERCITEGCNCLDTAGVILYDGDSSQMPEFTPRAGYKIEFE